MPEPIPSPLAVPAGVSTRSTLARGACAFAVLVSSIVVAGAVAAEDPPLELGREHVGLTSESLTEAEQHAATEQAVQRAIENSEWTDADITAEQEAVFSDEASTRCPPPVEADPATPPVSAGPIEVDAVGVDDYGSCVEVAIRGGNGFKAASAVCQVLFPQSAVAFQSTARAPVPEVEQALPSQDVSASPTRY